MAVIKKTEKDGIVECLIDSSNILHSEYDKSKNTLKLTFKSGTRYVYKNIINRDYVRFEVSESQGSVFNKTMTKYDYNKLISLTEEDLLVLKEEIINYKD
tara:strand:- start:174 stop:473 length:300 start_codon:yes stop_codon:yes gene_type:complete